MMFARLCAFALLLLAAPLPARAHAILLEAVPAAGQTVRAGHTEFHLRFNSRIDADRSRIALLRAGGASEILRITHGETADRLVVSADLAPGAQVLRWQVLAVDGHITRGEIRFTVEAPR